MCVIVSLVRYKLYFEEEHTENQQGSLDKLLHMKYLELLFVLNVQIAYFTRHQYKKQPTLQNRLKHQSQYQKRKYFKLHILLFNRSIEIEIVDDERQSEIGQEQCRNHVVL